MAKKQIVKNQSKTKEQVKGKDGAKKTSKSFSLVGFITGIVSVASFWTGFIGLVTGIVSIVFSSISKNRQGLEEKDAKHAKQGFIMGIVGTVLSAICVVVWPILSAWILWKYIVW